MNLHAIFFRHKVTTFKLVTLKGAVIIILLTKCSLSFSEKHDVPNVNPIEPSYEYFQDCENCPEMAKVLGGKFIIGETEFNEDERPQKQILISEFAVARFEVTVAEYRRFIEQTGFEEKSPCLAMGDNGSWFQSPDASWLKPGFEQTEDHPVVCVSYQAALAFIEWLNDQVSPEYAKYRLLTESEWEYVARAGSDTTYWWGNNEEDFCKYTNGTDKLASEKYPQWIKAGKCQDGHLYTAPVGFYAKPNAFGAEDMVGNVWEWVQDCYKDSYVFLPKDGKPQVDNNCEKNVIRGGAWGDYGSFYLRSAYRGAWHGVSGFSNLGFRVAKDL